MFFAPLRSLREKFHKIIFQIINVIIENKIPKVGKVFASFASKLYSIAKIDEVIIGGIAHSKIDIIYSSLCLCKIK